MIYNIPHLFKLENKPLTYCSTGTSAGGIAISRDMCADGNTPNNDLCFIGNTPGGGSGSASSCRSGNEDGDGEGWCTNGNQNSGNTFTTCQTGGANP